VGVELTARLASRPLPDGVTWQFPSSATAHPTAMSKWINPNGSRINIIVQNRRVVQRAQFGLH